jgi:peptidoglycan-associated lipoprotein
MPTKKNQEESVMKKRSAIYLCALIVFAMFLSGCGCFMQAQKGETPPPPPPPVAAPAPEPAKEIPVQPAPPPPAPVVMMKDINFDFDKYAVRAGDAEILKQDAEWFKANPGKKARIEGNCDERGTVEYNLVLGQKRADSTKAYLVSIGVDAKVIDTVSYGKERPVCMDHNEGCWAQNRRAHLEPAK